MQPPRPPHTFPEVTLKPQSRTLNPFIKSSNSKVQRCVKNNAPIPKFVHFLVLVRSFGTFPRGSTAFPFFSTRGSHVPAHSLQTSRVAPGLYCNQPAGGSTGWYRVVIIVNAESSPSSPRLSASPRGAKPLWCDWSLVDSELRQRPVGGDREPLSISLPRLRCYHIIIIIVVIVDQDWIPSSVHTISPDWPK